MRVRSSSLISTVIIHFSAGVTNGDLCLDYGFSPVNSVGQFMRISRRCHSATAVVERPSTRLVQEHRPRNTSGRHSPIDADTDCCRSLPVRLHTSRSRSRSCRRSSCWIVHVDDSYLEDYPDNGAADMHYFSGFTAKLRLIGMSVHVFPETRTDETRSPDLPIAGFGQDTKGATGDR